MVVTLEAPCIRLCIKAVLLKQAYLKQNKIMYRTTLWIIFGKASE